MNDTIQSLREQLAEAEENLRLIQEREAEYVESEKIPLQLVKNERRLEAQVADLRARLDRLAETPCPYRGLEPFEAEHADVYFGRETMVARLVAKVNEAPFIAVVGPSGCGKSSLVRAGLVTALREGALPGSRDWAIRIFRPGRDPLRALAAGLVALLEPEALEVDRMAETRKLAGHLRGGTLSMDDVTARLREMHPDLPRLLLLADQFEELYTECDDEAARRAFVYALLAAAETGWVTVLLALRADFYGRVLEDWALGERVDTDLVNVLPMSEEELRAAIEKPALKTGREFEPGLVDDILKGVAGEPGNLPLLEFALTELWDGQTAAGLLTHAAYKEIGGVEGAIARRAESVYGELEKQGQGETVRRIFLRLTHYGEGAEGTRRRATLDDLVTLRTPRAAVEPVVKALADARLLVTGRDAATDAATVEAAHEALIRGWERLRRWLDEDRAFGLWRERLAVAQRTWEEAGQDEGALLRGAPLAEAEGWLAGRGDDMNEAERGFIEAGRERQAREENRWQELQGEVVAAKQLATLGTAIAALQHRINNTFNIIIPNVTRLRSRVDTTDETIAKILDIIERNARSTSDIIARIQEPLRKIEAQDVDVNAMLNSVVGLVQEQWQADTARSVITVVLSLDDSIPLVQAPISQIAEVFRNLVDNAYCAMSDDGQLTVTSRYTDGTIQNGTIQIRVQDTGGGISPAVQKRLFVKPVLSKEQGGGAGLGLWLSQLMLQSIGGGVTIEKSDHTGTTMLVQIPTPGTGNEERPAAVRI